MKGSERARHARLPLHYAAPPSMATAVVTVVAYNALATLLPGGFGGVAIFFVVSGFLISRNILGDLARGPFSIQTFYARPARRIFPASTVVLVATPGVDGGCCLEMVTRMSASTSSAAEVSSRT